MFLQETQSFANKKTAPEDRHYIPSGKPSPSPTVRSLTSRQSPAHKSPLGGNPSPAVKANLPTSSAASPPKSFPASASSQSPALRPIPVQPPSNAFTRLQLKSPTKPSQGAPGVAQPSGLSQGKPRIGPPKPASLPRWEIRIGCSAFFSTLFLQPSSQ